MPTAIIWKETSACLALGDGEELEAPKVIESVSDHVGEAAFPAVWILKLPFRDFLSGVPVRQQILIWMLGRDILHATLLYPNKFTP